jgi:hypothetical protein
MWHGITGKEARARDDIQSIELDVETKIGTVLDGGDEEIAAGEEFEINDLEIGHQYILLFEFCATGAPGIFHSNSAHDDGLDFTVVGRIVEFESGAELDNRSMDAFQETFPDDGLVGEEVEGFVGL